MLRIDIDDSGMRATLQGVANALADLSPMWKDIHDVVIDMEKEQFETEGGYSGERWDPLNPTYAAWKAREYPGRDIMRLRNRLYRSLTTKNHEDHVYETGPSWMEVGTRVLYARAHQYGYPPKGLPKRVIVPKLTKEQGEAIVDIVFIHVLKGARESLSGVGG